MVFAPGDLRLRHEAGDFAWWSPTQRRVNAQLIVIGLELTELSLEIVRIPEEYVVQILSAASADEPLYERVRKRHLRHGLHLFDIDDA